MRKPKPHALFMLLCLISDSRSGPFTVVYSFQDLQVQHHEPVELVDFILHQKSIEF